MSIQIDGMTKKFGRKVAVDDLTLHVEAGELYAFLGPNGAGKTTTLKVVAGLLRPTTGSVRVGGFDLNRQAMEARRILSYVPDQPFLYDKLTGREFLHFVGAMYGMGRVDIEKQTAELQELFEFGEYIDQLAETYSHGMKQRIVISSALLHDPKVIVVDEPMVGLDPKSTNLLKRILRKRTEQGSAVFMSTHTLAIAEETATRVGIIHRGRIVALGSLDDIYSQARSDRNLEEAFLRLTEESVEGR